MPCSLSRILSHMLSRMHACFNGACGALGVQLLRAHPKRTIDPNAEDRNWEEWKEGSADGSKSMREQCAHNTNDECDVKMATPHCQKTEPQTILSFPWFHSSCSHACARSLFSGSQRPGVLIALFARSCKAAREDCPAPWTLSHGLFVSVGRQQCSSSASTRILLDGYVVVACERINVCNWKWQLCVVSTLRTT